MHYKNIYIRDFGIFNNQNLNNISKNLVVIGGKNRAGKSTFLKLLRYLPYGLPQDNSIPPAKNKYYIEAELVNKNKNYKLFLDGFAAPKVIDEAQQPYSAPEIFNNLDQLSYQQLFSIGLEELQQLTKIAKGKREKKRLFSILLGAGMSELVKVPELADKYLNKAKSIGGVLGDPSVASFKPYFNEIKDAEGMRDQALLEIEEFNRKRDKLKENKEKLSEVKTKIDDHKNKYILLDLLKNNYRTVEKIEKLKLEIKKSIINKGTAESKLINKNLENKIKNSLNFIKSHIQKIESYQQKKSILQEKAENYQAKKDKLNNDYQTLILELEDLDCSWEQPLKELEKVKLDLITEQKLNSELKKFDQLKSEIKKLKEDIKKLELTVKENKEELANLNFISPSAVKNKSYLLLILSFLVLVSSFFINYSQINYFVLILSLLSYIYYSSNYKNSKLKKEKEDELKNDIQIKNKELKNLTSELDKKNSDLEKIKINLDKYNQILGITDNDNFSFLDTYYREIREKKRRYKNLKKEEKENQKQKNKLESELKNIYNLIKKADKNLKINFSTNFNNNQKLFGEMKSLFNDLNLINELKEIAVDYQNKKTQLNYTLKASEKNKKALAFKNENTDYYWTFINYAKGFSSLEAVEEEKNLIAENLNSLKNKKENLEEKITTLKNKINELSSSTKIEKAQHKINQAQNNLEKKAQRYAVNKSVNFILKKLRSRMIEKAEQKLLKPASKILAEITSNHYKNLQTTVELEKSDFKTIRADGKQFNSVQQLSRGSLEQLFLAVRISRIKEIEPPLPLVLDDSLVNFDNNHLYNTAKIISNLADKHQIFILTCHPDLVSYISSISDSAQYWKLEEGKFELSNQKKLLDHLSL